MRMMRAILTVGSFTAISRVFGLIRESLISHLLGASLVTDAFFIAFKFPNLFRRIFAEGAFNAAFVPLFSKQLVSHGPKEARQTAERVFAVMVVVLTIFVVGVVLLTPWIIHIIAPGFATTPERMDLAITFTRITFPYILFISLAAHLSGVLNSLDRFAAAAGVPILLNVVMITSLLLAPELGFSYGTSLSWAVFLAGILQFGWLYISCWRIGFPIHLRWPHMTPEVKNLIKLMIPGVIGAGVMNVNVFIDMILASYLPEKSVSFLYYADRLNQLPLSIFGIAIGTALLPSLSRQLRAGETSKAERSKTLATEFALQVTLPAALGLILLADPIIDLIYGLPPLESRATAQALAAFALGIPAYVLNKVFTTSFFARQDTKTPVKIASCCIAINLVLNLWLMQWMAHVGLALATSIAAWLNTLLLYLILHRRQWFTFPWSLVKLTSKVMICCLVMAVGLIQFNVSTLVSDTLLLRVGLAICIGMGLYGISAYCCGILNIQRLRQAFSRQA
jgi:putative peptidoglycan lipid II flippase